MLKILKGLKRKPKLTEKEYAEKLDLKNIDPVTGHPFMDGTPMAPPIGYKKTPSMVELVREMVRSEKLRLEALESGHESFEDADDFDVDDDPQELKSGWENDFDPPLRELLSAGAQELEKKQAGPKEKERGGGGAEPPSGKQGDKASQKGSVEPTNDATRRDT